VTVSWSEKDGAIQYCCTLVAFMQAVAKQEHYGWVRACSVRMEGGPFPGVQAGSDGWARCGRGSGGDGVPPPISRRIDVRLACSRALSWNRIDTGRGRGTADSSSPIPGHSARLSLDGHMPFDPPPTHTYTYTDVQKGIHPQTDNKHTVTVQAYITPYQAYTHTLHTLLQAALYTSRVR
jgi:hypothetical protein